MRRIAVAFLLFGLLLAACASAIQFPTPDRKTPVPRGSYLSPPAGEPAAEPTAQPGELPPAAQAARAELAALLGTDSASIAVLSVEPNQWPDACLGLGAPAEVCAQQVVDGYRIDLQSIGALFTYRTNLDGTNVRLAFPPAADAQAPAQVARAVLAGQLGLSDPAQVQLVQTLPVYWLNACLGVSSPDVACAEVITPGFRILLEAQGAQYEFHTNQDGSQVIQVDLP